MGSVAFIALGANLGDRRATFQRAVGLLTERLHIAVQSCSALYETAAVGGPANQPPYLNAVLSVATDLSPRELLAALLQTEDACGRQRTERHGPRTLDLDLLLYDDLVLADAALELPHPRLHLRRFVLKPLCDIAPRLLHPRLGRSFDSLLSGLNDDDMVRLLAEPPWLADLTGHTSSSAP